METEWFATCDCLLLHCRPNRGQSLGRVVAALGLVELGIGFFVCAAGVCVVDHSFVEALMGTMRMRSMMHPWKTASGMVWQVEGQVLLLVVSWTSHAPAKYS